MEIIYNYIFILPQQDIYEKYSYPENTFQLKPTNSQISNLI